MMRQAVHAAAHNLGDIVRQIDFSYRQYQEAEARRRENSEWLAGERIRFQNPLPAGDGQDWLSLALNNYLAAMQSQYSAASDAANLLAQYNTQLVRLEEAMGTLAMTFNISLEGDTQLSPRKAAALASDVAEFGLVVNPYQTSTPPTAPSSVPASPLPEPAPPGFPLPQMPIQPTRPPVWNQPAAPPGQNWFLN